MQSLREDDLQRATGRARDRRLGVLALLLGLALCAGTSSSCAVPGRARALDGCARAGVATVACALSGGRRAVFALLPSASPAGPAPAGRVALCLRLTTLESAAANASWSARYEDAMPLYNRDVLALLLGVALCAGAASSCAVPGRARALDGCARAGVATVACALSGGRRAVFALLPSPAPAGPTPAGRVALCLRLTTLESAAANASWSARYEDATPLAAGSMEAACWAAGGEACAVSVVAGEGLWTLAAARAQPSEAAFWSCAAEDASTLRELRAGPAAVRAAWLRDGLRGCAPSLRALRLDDLDLGAEALALQPLPALTSLQLAGLLYLPPEIFQSTPALEILSLRRCFLNGLPAGLPALRRLRSLEVTENQGYAFRVRPDQLSALVALEALRLTRTSTVDASTLRALPALPRLRVLDLSRTRVRFHAAHDHDGADSPFDKFPALEELRLSRNMMEHFPDRWLEGRSLRVVDLSENMFTEWPLIRGCDMGSLDLSQNSLKTVENLGRLNTTVQRLDLSMNDIAQWNDPEVFYAPNGSDFHTESEPAECAWAEDVNLSLNAIVALTEPMTQSLSRVRRVVLDDNMLDCADCGMPRWGRWALESGRVANAEALRCSSPPQEAGVPLSEARGFESACEPVPAARPWHALAVALPLFGACALLAAAVGAAVYRYRAEIAYTLHLFRIRQERAEDRGQHYLYDAFVCYSGGDRVWVLRTLAPLLEAPPARYRLCLHERDFALGSLIVDNIARAIERSRRVVVVLSAHFVASKWCNWELDMANHRSFEDSRGFLILIQLGRLERRSLPRHLRFLMDTRTYLEWPDATGAGPPAAVRDAAQRRLQEALGPSLRERRRRRPRPQPALAHAVLPIEDAAVCPPRAEQGVALAIEHVKPSPRNGDGPKSKKHIPAIEDGSVERTYRGSISKAKLLPDTMKKKVFAIEDSPKARKEV